MKVVPIPLPHNGNPGVVPSWLSHPACVPPFGSPGFPMPPLEAVKR